MTYILLDWNDDKIYIERSHLALSMWKDSYENFPIVSALVAPDIN